MTGQGMTWVLVADARQARILTVEDAGLPARVRHTLRAEPDGRARDESGDLPEVSGYFRKASAHHGALKTSTAPEDKAEHHFARELVRMLDAALATNAFHHLVLVAPPKLLGILRESLPRGLAPRLRAAEAKDYQHLPDKELEERVRSLVHIWPQGGPTQSS